MLDPLREARTCGETLKPVAGLDPDPPDERYLLCLTRAPIDDASRD
jgi:hypothetical protein